MKIGEGSNKSLPVALEGLIITIQYISPLPVLPLSLILCNVILTIISSRRNIVYYLKLGGARVLPAQRAI